MSAVIKTTTPFVIESVLIDALKSVNADPIVVTESISSRYNQRNRPMFGDILTNRKDYNGIQFFRKIGERWLFLHDQDELYGSVVSQVSNKTYMKVGRFLSDLTEKYQHSYTEYLNHLAEQERFRLEEERKARVEATRQQAIAKAKAQGYSVKETRKGTQIQLVLTRTV
jgi:hypothetical protein